MMDAVVQKYALQYSTEEFNKLMDHICDNDAAIDRVEHDPIQVEPGSLIIKSLVDKLETGIQLRVTRGHNQLSLGLTIEGQFHGFTIRKELGELSLESPFLLKKDEHLCRYFLTDEY